MRSGARTALVLLALAAGGRALAERPFARAEVLAEVVERLTRFVEWPVAALPPDGRFVLCVVGQGEVVTRLRHIAADQPIKQRPGVVRPTVDGKGCHLVFVVSAEVPRQRELLTRLRRAPVLTISELDGRGSTPALVDLYLERGRPRFSIDAQGARASGLAVRSRLLRLATETGRKAP